MQRRLGVTHPCKAVNERQRLDVENVAAPDVVGFVLLPTAQLGKSGSCPSLHAGEQRGETAAGASSAATAERAERRRPWGLRRGNRAVSPAVSAAVPSETAVQERRLLQEVSRSCGFLLEADPAVPDREVLRPISPPPPVRTRQQQQEAVGRLADGLPAQACPARETRGPGYRSRTGSPSRAAAFLAEHDRRLCRPMSGGPARVRARVVTPTEASLALAAAKLPLRRFAAAAPLREVSSAARPSVGAPPAPSEKVSDVLRFCLGPLEEGSAEGDKDSSDEGPEPPAPALATSLGGLSSVLHAAFAGRIPVHAVLPISKGEDAQDQPLPPSLRDAILAAALSGAVPVRSITTAETRRESECGGGHEAKKTTRTAVSTGTGVSEETDPSYTSSVLSSLSTDRNPEDYDEEDEDFPSESLEMFARPVAHSQHPTASWHSPSGNCVLTPARPQSGCPAVRGARAG